MAAKSAKRSKPGAKKSSDDTVAEMLKSQMDNFRIWKEVFGEMAQKQGNSEELARILEKHFKRVEEKAKEVSPELFNGSPEALRKQKEFYTYGMQSYSQMLQEYLVSATFLNSMRDILNASLLKKIEMDGARDEMLKSMGIPSRKDIQEIHHNSYIINKKLDRINELLEDMGAGK